MESKREPIDGIVEDDPQRRVCCEMCGQRPPTHIVDGRVQYCETCARELHALFVGQAQAGLAQLEAVVDTLRDAGLDEGDIVAAVRRFVDEPDALGWQMIAAEWQIAFSRDERFAPIATSHSLS